MRTSLYGRPGPVYLDMPDDVILGRVDEDEELDEPAPSCPSRPACRPIPRRSSAALEALQASRRTRS